MKCLLSLGVGGGEGCLEVRKRSVHGDTIKGCTRITTNMNPFLPTRLKMHHHVDWNSVIFLFTNEVSYIFECPWRLRNGVKQVPSNDMVRNIMKLKCYGCHYSNGKQQAQMFSPILNIGSWRVYDFLRVKWLDNSHAGWWSLLRVIQGPLPGTTLFIRPPY